MKTTLIFSIIVFVLLCLNPKNTIAQIPYTIGTGSTPSSNFLVKASQKYSWSYSIYKASEFPTAAVIHRLEYESANSSNGFYSHIKVYMVHTSSTTFTSSAYVNPVTLGATKVYDGRYGWVSQGWAGIDLQTPFMYNGTDNLMIIWVDDLYFSSNYNLSVKCHSTSGNSSKTGSSNYSFPNNGTLSNIRPNVKMFISTAYNNNLMVNKIKSPKSVVKASSAVPFQVEVINVGKQTQSNFQVKYSIDNGTTWKTKLITSSLAPNASMQVNFTSLTADMSTTGSYKCIAKVLNPSDAYASNDSVTEIITAWLTPYSGTYIVGADPADFPSLIEASICIDSAGLSAPVTLKMKTGSYEMEYAAWFSKNNGSAFNHGITIESQTGNQNDVIIKYPNTYDKFHLTGKMIYVFKTDLTIRNLTFLRDDSLVSAQNAISAINCNSVLIENNKFKGVYGLNNLTAMDIHTSYDTTDIYRIRNNTIESCSHGINAAGADSVFVYNNTISKTAFGINVYSLEWSDVYNNNLDSILGINYYGGMQMQGRNVNVHNNKVHALNGCALHVYNFDSTSVMRIYNNFFSTTQLIGTRPTVLLSPANKLRFEYNTVVNTGSDTNSVCLYIDGQYLPTQPTLSPVLDSISFTNNNIINRAGGVVARFYKYSSSLLHGDYNNFYSTGNNLFSWKSLSWSPYVYIPTFASFDTAWSQPHSISVNSIFISDVDLHSVDSSMWYMANPISGITTDIDGELRNTTTPDIGADEHSVLVNDVGLFSIDLPQDSCAIGLREVRVSILNGGSADLISDSLFFQLDNNPSISYYWTGNIESQKKDSSILIGNTNISLGVHSIKVWTNTPNNSFELNKANDTLIKTITGLNMPSIALDKNVLNAETKFCNDSITIPLVIYNTGSQPLYFTESHSSSTWLQYLSNTIDTVGVNDSLIVYYQFNSKSLSANSFTGNISFISNDLGNPNMSITCNFDVYSLMNNPVNLGGDDTSSCGSLLLNAGTFSNYQWNTGSTDSSILIQSSGDYSVMVTDNNCTSSDTIYVNVKLIPLVSIVNLAQHYCKEDAPIGLIGQPIGGQFYGDGIHADTLYPDSLQSGYHQVKYVFQDTNSCSDTAIITTYLSDATVDIGSDTSVCSSVTIMFSVNPNFSSYTWSTGATSNSIFVDSTGVGIGSKQINVVVVDSLNCSGNDHLVLSFVDCTSLNDIDSKSFFINVFPNPSTGVITLKSNTTSLKQLELNLIDVTGKVVLVKMIESSSGIFNEQLDLRSYPKGIYFILLSNGNQSKRIKIVLQ